MLRLGKSRHDSLREVRNFGIGSGLFRFRPYIKCMARVKRADATASMYIRRYVRCEPTVKRFSALLGKIACGFVVMVCPVGRPEGSQHCT